MNEDQIREILWRHLGGDARYEGIRLATAELLALQATDTAGCGICGGSGRVIEDRGLGTYADLECRHCDGTGDAAVRSAA